MFEKYEIKDLVKSTKDVIEEALEQAYDVGYETAKEELEEGK